MDRTSPQDSGSGAPTKYGVLLFPGFQLQDVAGPLDILNILSQTYPEITLSLFAATLEPVSTVVPAHIDIQPGKSASIGQSLVPTDTFDNLPKAGLDVLLIPGGVGTRSKELMEPCIEFIKKVYPDLKYVLTVCTGSKLLAQTGLLDGKKATSNKRSWKWVIQDTPKVLWQSSARWLIDGNIWTSSGITAGMDLMYAFVAAMFGGEKAQEIADASEYHRNTDSEHDPFAARWGTI